MQNFNPEELTARVVALETKTADVERRLHALENEYAPAGVGATQEAGVTIPESEIARHDAPAAAVGSYSGKPNSSGSPMADFLAKKAEG